MVALISKFSEVGLLALPPGMPVSVEPGEFGLSFLGRLSRLPAVPLHLGAGGLGNLRLRPLLRSSALVAWVGTHYLTPRQLDNLLTDLENLPPARLAGLWAGLLLSSSPLSLAGRLLVSCVVFRCPP